MAALEPRCPVCSDAATRGRVVALVDARTARVDVGGATEDVAVDLVDVRVGDVVLVHGGVAIGTLA